MHLKTLLRKNQKFLDIIRQYFRELGVIEVDVDSLSKYTVSTPFIDSFEVNSVKNSKQYLFTSPEVQLKKLLALGSGDIYYLGKVFRDDGISTLHLNEFNMLEWYRVGKKLENVIAECVKLLKLFFPKIAYQQLTYKKCFSKYAQISDIFNCDRSSLIKVLQSHHKKISHLNDLSHEELEQLVWTEVIEKQFDDGIVVITELPMKFSDMAKKNKNNSNIAIRFEMYIDRIELVNGYEENCDQQDLLEKFDTDNSFRKKLGKDTIAIDPQFLQAIKILPECTGVALGLDRLLKIWLNLSKIQDCKPSIVAEQQLKNCKMKKLFSKQKSNLLP